MKCWKDKADSDTVQKERRLQENKRTIETQRKAIQELQVSLSLSNHIQYYLFCIIVIIDNKDKEFLNCL